MADQTLEIKSFEGGMTDNFIQCPLSKYEMADNLIIRPDAKLESRKGSTVLDTVCYQVPFIDDPKRVDSITKFQGERFFQTMGKLYRQDTSWQEILGPGSTSLFSIPANSGHQNSWADWNNHLFITNDYRVRPTFLYVDGGVTKLRTLGLPKVTNAEADAVSVVGAAGTESRSYQLVRSHTYSINGVEYTSLSAVSKLIKLTQPLPATLTNLPVLVNTPHEHYETSTIKLEIYRSAKDQSVFYKVGEVTNGTTSFVDSILDTDLTLLPILYIESDDLDYDQPPRCKFVIQAQGVLYFLNVRDSLNDVHPNRIVQANPDQPFAAPESNAVDVDGDLTGGGIAVQYPVVFTKDRTYRLQGVYDSTGNGGIQAIEIARNLGCVSHKSIVSTQFGLFFASRNGFCFTDGYQVTMVSEDIPNTYSKITQTEAQAKRIYGAFDPVAKRISWAATSQKDVGENDCIFVAHGLSGISGNMPFTRFTGGAWRENFNPTAIYFDEEESFLIRGEKLGYVLCHREDANNDVRITPAITPDLWTEVPVIYDYRGPATDCGTATMRKWATKLVTYVDSLGKVTIMPYSNNDNTGIFTEMTEIRANALVLWGDTEITWGDSTRWNYIPIVSGVRRFPSRSARFSFKQVRYSNSYTIVESSEDLGLATFDNAANTVTLDNPDLTWSLDAVDYYISTPVDEYTKEYRIVVRSGSTLTVEDDTGSLPSGSLEFKVRGYRKDEGIRLLSYSIIYQVLTPSQTPARGQR